MQKQGDNPKCPFWEDGGKLSSSHTVECLAVIRKEKHVVSWYAKAFKTAEWKPLGSPAEALASQHWNMEDYLHGIKTQKQQQPL